jgi:hypothetical protein
MFSLGKAWPFGELSKKKNKKLYSQPADLTCYHSSLPLKQKPSIENDLINRSQQTFKTDKDKEKHRFLLEVYILGKKVNLTYYFFSFSGL